MKNLLSRGVASALTLALAAAAFSQIDSFPVSGTATGYFNNGLTSIDGLSYKGSAFDVEMNQIFTTNKGSLSLEGDLYGSAKDVNVDNFGSFFANKPVSTYAGDTFTLVVSFTSPNIVSASNQSITTWTFDNKGTLDFDGFVGGNPQFVGAKAAGSLSASFNGNGTIAQGQWVAPIGVIGSNANPVPEPAPMAVMGGLGLGLFFRRKKSRATRASL